MSSKTVPASLDEPGIRDALTLFVDGSDLTRADVAEKTGWARTTVTARTERLLEDGLLEAFEERVNGRGRPATRYRLASGAGVLLVADVGATGMRVARCDLAGNIEATTRRAGRIEDGPYRVLDKVQQAWKELLGEAKSVRPWGVAVGLPGPIEHPRGRVVDPPIMTGWDGFEVTRTIGGWYDTVAHVENDANALAVGEMAAAAEKGVHISDLLVVKVGTGVGSGIISGGRVLRGAVGAAGDIGHTELDSDGSRADRPICRCGKTGCVEAYAGGWALVREAAAKGLDVTDVQSFIKLLSEGDPIARALTADAGRVIGSAIATAVSLLNPQEVLLGGSLGLAGDHLIAGVRERVYARSLPLATHSLTIDTIRLGHDAGVRGLAHELSRKVLLGVPAA